MIETFEDFLIKLQIYFLASHSGSVRENIFLGTDLKTIQPFPLPFYNYYVLKCFMYIPTALVQMAQSDLKLLFVCGSAVFPQSPQTLLCLAVRFNYPCRAPSGALTFLSWPIQHMVDHFNWNSRSFPHGVSIAPEWKLLFLSHIKISVCEWKTLGFM